MKFKKFNVGVTCLMTCFLVACSTTHAPQPQPVADVSIGSKIVIPWDSSRISSSIAGSFVPVVDNNAVFTADSNGNIFRLDDTDGSVINHFALKRKLSSGTAVSADAIFVTTDDAHLLSIRKVDGSIKWEVALPTIAIEAPQVSGDIVVVKTNDAQLSAYDVHKGTLLWVYQKTNPPLTLRAYNSFQIVGKEVVILGEATGRLALINLLNGSVIWENQLAVAQGSTDLDKLTDIGMRPTLQGKTICVATYNGKIACLDALSSNVAWTKSFSSSSGVLIDEQNVYTIDVDGVVYAFDRVTGAKVWHNDILKYRHLGVPVFLNNNILIIDHEGYINVFAHDNGKLITRRPSNLAGGTSYPYSDNSKVIIQSGNGHIAKLME